MRSIRAWGLLTALGMLGACYGGIALPGDRGASAGADDDAPQDGDPDVPDDGDEPSDDDDEPAVPSQPLHRLNRLEYNNTVRDLLGTDLRPANAFGPDPEANGFDNMAAQLKLSPGLLDGYDKAARDSIADALDERPVFSARFAADELSVTAGYPVGELWGLSGGTATADVDVPQAGDAEIVLTAGASVVGSAAQPQVRLEVDGVALATFTVQGTAAVPGVHVHPIALQPGTHQVRVVPTNFVNEAAQNTSNNVLVASLEVRSVALEDGPGRDLVYVCDPVGEQSESCYEAIIGKFAFRAWRRPLSEDEQDALLHLFAQVRAHGESEPAALRLVMRAIMTSPKFVFRARTFSDADTKDWLDDYVLASRLSYFLWSSMPDDRLFEAAAQGRLATDEGLSEAVAWMLADEKAQGLLDGFAEQWLSTRHLQNSSPSPEVFPEFDESLRAAMTLESKLLFGDFLAGGAPVTDLIRPDFAYLSDRLAEHYGLPPVGSSELIRVPMTQGRRGLLYLSAWLTAQSDAERSSPIRRGHWVSERVLCIPVPPPPPGLVIEPIEHDGATSVRELLEKHRSDPACASCHALLDVLGIGFEELDGVGREVLDQDVDNLGELPDGRTFEGAGELSELFEDSEVFAECLTEKLFTYAVGRPAQSFDAPYLEEIAGQAVQQRLDLPAVIDAIVHTPAFRSPAALGQGD